MGEGIEGQPIDRELNADADAARREVVESSFRELLGEDPVGDHDHARRWLAEISKQLRMLADVTTDNEAQVELRTEATDLDVQVASLVGGREPDEEAWRQLIGNAKDIMSTILHSPETDKEAA